jgi:hypothetical protein
MIMRTLASERYFGFTIRFFFKLFLTGLNYFIDRIDVDFSKLSLQIIVNDEVEFA